jgi:hypothetical protein
MALTEKAGNPANRLRVRYAQLMGVSCVETLAQEALATVEGAGVSPRNMAVFRYNLAQAKHRGIDGVRSYLTNFMLAADGLAVIGARRSG